MKTRFSFSAFFNRNTRDAFKCCQFSLAGRKGRGEEMGDEFNCKKPSFINIDNKESFD